METGSSRPDLRDIAKSDAPEWNNSRPRRNSQALDGDLGRSRLILRRDFKVDYVLTVRETALK